MKEPRVEKMVAELRATVERLNRINAILEKCDVQFYLARSSRTGNFELSDIQQTVKYE